MADTEGEMPDPTLRRFVARGTSADGAEGGFLSQLDSRMNQSGPVLLTRSGSDRSLGLQDRLQDSVDRHVNRFSGSNTRNTSLFGGLLTRGTGSGVDVENSDSRQ